MIVSLSLGLLSHHIVNPQLDYCGKINNSGTIQNSYIIATVGDQDFRGGVIVGKDSTCSTIKGLVFEKNLYKNLDLVFGVYNTNTKAYHNRGIGPVTLDGRSTPIIGVNYKISIYKSKNFTVNLHNLINPYLTSHAVNFSF